MKSREEQRNEHFDELYAAFYGFYIEELKRADVPHKKVRLQLTTQFFDDLALQKVVFPLFEKFGTNVEDKRAVARAAYYDALILHSRTAGLKWETVSDKQLAKEGSQYK